MIQVKAKKLVEDAEHLICVRKKNLASGEKVSFFGMFRFASTIDKALFGFGILGALGTGSLFPIGIIFAGSTLDSIGQGLDSSGALALAILVRNIASSLCVFFSLITFSYHFLMMHLFCKNREFQ